MKTATVIQPFMRDNDVMQRGQTFECSGPEFAKWASLGFIAAYETKVKAPVKKKKKLSRSAPAGRASRKKTAKKSAKAKSAKKS
jgi:hypothetical protein